MMLLILVTLRIHWYTELLMLVMVMMVMMLVGWLYVDCSNRSVCWLLTCFSHHSMLSSSLAYSLANVSFIWHCPSVRPSVCLSVCDCVRL